MSKYKYKKPDNIDLPTVELELPSGNVILMAKPSKFAIIFNLRGMPSSLTEKAMNAWAEKGVGNEQQAENEIAAIPQSQRLHLLEQSLKIRDKVLELSREPKLVFGIAKNENELSVDEVSDDDLDYLFKWVASGGVAPQVTGFPGGPKQDALASASRKNERPETVDAGGAE